MSLIKGNHGGLGGAGAPGGALGSFYSHTLDQSLRFDGSSAYLNFTPSSSTTATVTISFWVKRSKLGATQYLFASGAANARGNIGFNSSDQFFFQGFNSSGANSVLTSSMLFRDVSSWYHIVIECDGVTTTSNFPTNTNVYVNGSTISMTHSTASSPSGGFRINDTQVKHIGALTTTASSYLSGYMAEVHWIDGTAVDVSSFGETKDGVWVAKEYTGSHGAAGWHLTFSDSNYIGRDKSGSKTLVTSPSFSTFGGGDTNFTQANYDRAFDNNLTTSGCDRTGSGGIIEITPSSSVTPVSHTMININSAAYTAASRPNSVLLQGSNDGGSNWTTIDDLTNGSGADTATTSSFSNTTSYAKLRLNISENHGGSNTRFGEYIVIASEDNGDGENIFFNNNLAASDVVPDSPTNNWCTNNSAMRANITHSEGNLKMVGVGNNFDNTAGTFLFDVEDTGGWYWEGYVNSGGVEVRFGISKPQNLYFNQSDPTYNFAHSSDGIAYKGTGSKSTGGTDSSYGDSFTTGDVIGIAVKAGALYFYKNGSIQNSGTAAATGLTGQYVPAMAINSTLSLSTNYGQDSTFAGAVTAGGNSDAKGLGDFKHSVPSGYKALCTSNLPDITIGPGQTNQSDYYFETMLYTGNGAVQHIGSGGAQHPQDTTTIANSVRFNDDDSPRLEFSPSSSGNRKTWTLSLWVKRANITGAYRPFFSAGTSGTSWALMFSDEEELFIQSRSSSSNQFVQKTANLFRDVSAWYHIVYAFDTTQATDTNRSKLYVNGEQLTLLQVTSNTIYPSQNTDYHVNNSSLTHYIGYGATHNGYLDGYLAEVNFIDGTALDPTYFGQVGSNGYWIPKALSGLTYGTNGFRLDFADSAALGDDESGNTNDFTVTNLAATDQVIDSPTQNFSTMDPNRYSGIGTFSEGNLTVATSTNNRATYGTIAVPSSGKWYYEVRVDSYASGGGAYMGWGTNVAEGDNEYAADHGISFSSYNEQVLLDNSGQSGGYGSNGTNVASNGDVYSVLLDVDNGLFYYAKNGTYFNSANPSNGTGGLSVGSVLAGAATEIRPMLTRGGSYNETYTFNFGQDPSFNGGETAPGTDKTDANGVGKFLYDVPTGFLALMDDNIPQEGLESPDFVWIKNRSAAVSHVLQDSVRGIGSNGVNFNTLISDTTGAEFNQADADGVSSLDANGFTVGYTDSSAWNESTTTYVAWNWKAGGTAVSNTDGSITSSVSAAPDAGFSICTYTGTSTVSESFGHGLNQAPELVITKARNTTDAWRVHGSVLGTDKFLALSGTNAVATDSSNGGFPDNTDTLVNLGYESTNGTNYVAYCFHSVEGYSKVGSYEGNSSSTDGAFVYTGFRPSWIIGKNADASGRWWIYDNKRTTFNDGGVENGRRLQANANTAESTSDSSNKVLFFSNGFKVNSSNSEWNTGNTYIYLAFAEQPFKFANAR